MSGTGVLLLTDVVDSTQLTQAVGDVAMARIWAAHDRAARDLLPLWRGREIDKTDGMLMLFERTGDAVGYAQAYHEALARLDPPLKARAGVHVGPVILRENTPEDIARGAKPLEVDGLAKPTAARVMSLACGAQTLLTPEAHAALLAEWTSTEDPDATAADRFVSHGHWLLKGLSEPIEVREALRPGLPPQSPPDADKAMRMVRRGESWVAARDIPNNLPEATSTFVGRETERREVAKRLERDRIVTLLGMGGVGKTRLALQIALEIRHRFVEGVWQVDLSVLREPDLVLRELANALNVREEASRPLVQTLIDQCRGRPLLIIFDTCEHLAAAVAALAHQLLRALPDLRVLATSRVALGVPGEATVPVSPLPLPARGARFEQLAQSPSVQLFVKRAQQARPAYELTPAEGPAVAELVTRLEGIPLALELAAARVRAMSVADINARLRDRYRLLTGGAKVLQQRQQTLRALVDWSYELLDEREKLMLQRAGLFIGGFDLEAAESVCTDEEIDSFDVMDLLSSLVEKSLLLLEEREQRTRYRMLETLREYATEKLEASGVRAELAKRHCEYYFGQVKKAQYGEMGSAAEGVAYLEDNLDNIRAGIALALAGEADAFLAVKYSTFLQRFWLLRGYASEGRRIVEAALALPAVQASEMAQAFALYVGAALAGAQGENARAREMLQRCLALRRNLGRPVDVAATLSTLGLELAALGDSAAAIAHEQEALEIFTQAGDAQGQMIGLLHIGRYHLDDGNLDAAEDFLQRGLTRCQQAADQELIAAALWWLAELAVARGDLDTAQSRLEAAQATAELAGDRGRLAKTQASLARVALRSDHPEAAAPAMRAALPALLEMGLHAELLDAVDDIQAWMSTGETPQASGAALLGVQVNEMRERLAIPRPGRRRTIPPAPTGDPPKQNPASGGGVLGGISGDPLSLESLIQSALRAWPDA